MPKFSSISHSFHNTVDLNFKFQWNYGKRFQVKPIKMNQNKRNSSGKRNPKKTTTINDDDDYKRQPIRSGCSTMLMRIIMMKRCSLLQCSSPSWLVSIILSQCQFLASVPTIIHFCCSINDLLDYQGMYFNTKFIL